MVGGGREAGRRRALAYKPDPELSRHDEGGRDTDRNHGSQPAVG